MIYTVTLNPAIDKTIYVDGFQVDEVNRIKVFRNDPGGKGINVTKMVGNLDGDSVAIAIAGGGTGNMLEDLMKKSGIAYKTFRCSDETRVNTKMVDKVNGTFTDINEPGPTVSKPLINEIENYLKETLVDGDILVLSGSVPRGVPTTVYKDWCKLCKDKGVRVILDADRELFAEGIDGQPYMIKPNEKELSMYFGVDLVDPVDIAKHCSAFFAKGIEVVVVSLGKDGSMLLTKDDSVLFEPVDVEVKSTVGAGDSMVAAIAYELDTIKDANSSLVQLVDALVLGVAASSASIEQEGTIMGHKDRIMELKNRVKYKNIEIGVK